MQTEVSSIYATFQGEQNTWGIGEPVIFIRFSFCHLRCYKATFGNLCDTPEALEHGSGTILTIDEIMADVDVKSEMLGGVKRICLTGGDPLARPQEFLQEFFIRLAEEGYSVSVETSGTLDITPYLIHPHVSWVLDYKGKSTGIPTNKNRVAMWKNLKETDIIKFVIADEQDYTEMLAVINNEKTFAKIVAGVYQGKEGKLTTFDLFNLLYRDSMLGRVKINMQTHKLANPDYFNNPLKYKDT
jgi:7-carboxy-7-deazaguanine synthase